jgi:superfamily I DNA/RNA helicase
MITSSAVPGVEIPVISMTISSAIDENIEPVTLNVLNSNDMELISKIANAIALKESEISSSSASRQEKAEMWKGFRQALDNDFVTMFDIVDRDGPSRRTLKKAELWYYYAITTHTSQGKEFDNVFIHDTDLRLKMTDAPVETQGKNADEYKNLFYVAVSRAKKNAFVSTNGRRYNEVDGRWPMSRSGEFDTLPVSQTEEVFGKLKELGRQSDKC